MLALERELFVCQVPSLERREVARAKLLEFTQQLRQILSAALAELREPIVGFESPIGALLKDDARARNPVGTLPVNEVTDHVVRTPGLWSFGRGDPVTRKSPEHRAQRRGRAREHGDSSAQLEFHATDLHLMRLPESRAVAPILKRRLSLQPSRSPASGGRI